MDSSLAVVFLAVIALTSLLQAGFVGALAFGARLGVRKLDELDDTVERAVVPRIRKVVRLAGNAADLSEKSLAQARRVDGLVAGASRKAERYIDEASSRVEDAVERVADRVGAEVEARTARAREHRILRKLSNATAFAKGVRRALEVWQEAGDGGGPDPDDEGPTDPSPA